MDKALIFGVNSQDGYYLSQLCRKNNIDCIGVARSAGDWLIGDVSDYDFVENLIKTYKPAYVYHLAANSTTRHEALFENYKTISTGTLNILEAVKLWNTDCRVFITSSGLQFRNTGKPIKETDEFEANSAYSVARIQSVYTARYYRQLGLKTYIGYLFHHESPLRKVQHVSRKITAAVCRIANGSDEILEIGDPTVQKEWTFAGDVAAGIFALVNQDAVCEATIGSGKLHSIEEWLEVCFKLRGLDWTQHVRIKDNFSAEYKVFFSDPTTINSLGWTPKLNLLGLAKLMIDNEIAS